MPLIEPQQTIWTAAKQGRLAEVQRFVSEGTSIDARTRGEITPLHEASGEGHLDVVRWLLDQGADLNARTQREPGDAGSYSALHLAIQRGHEEVASLLIEKGAKVNSKMSDGTTPLMLAAETKRLDLAEFLLCNGADIHLQDQLGASAFSIAVLGGDLELASYFIRKGADVNEELGPSCGNLLMLVSCNKELEVVRFLIKHGANVLACDTKGDTALHLALLGAATAVSEWKSSDKEVVYKADNKEDAFLIVQLLIRSGANALARNNSGQTPLMLARKLKLHSFIELLQEAESNVLINPE